MDVTSYKRLTYRKFKGLYRSGINDNCPPEYAPVCQDIIFDAQGGIQTRAGSAASLVFPHTVKRLFLSTISDNLVPLTLDDSGNLYKNIDSSPMLTIAAMTDFVGLNMFNKTYILPCITTGSAVLYVWDGTNAIRPAAGAAPTAAAMGAADGIAGSIDVGTHLFTVSFVTNTGFTTKPSANITTYVAPGSKKVVLTGIPLGPTGTTQRVILATKSNLLLYYFAPGGTINDNTTTTVTLSFFDTSLTVSADYLFDLRESIPAANSAGAIDKFHGRMIVVNTSEDLVLVSRPGEPEAFNTVTGYIQLPSERDGNAALGTFQLRDVLYFTKSVGILSSSDNLGEPSTWPIFPIDGGCGAVSYGISSITAAQGHLTANDIALLADMDGLFYFDGVVRRPPLSTNIDDIWKQYVNISTIQQVTVFLDPFTERFFVSVVGMGSLLVGDFSEGLTYDKIKWSQWVFPFAIKSMTQCTLLDDEFAYRLRFSFVGTNNMYKYMPTATTDFGTAIGSKYRFAPSIFDEGAVNVFRYLRLRATSLAGSVTLALTIYLEDGTSVFVTPPALTITAAPGVDYARQINVNGEKMYLEVAAPSFRIQRLDVFGKPLFLSRAG